VAFRYLITAALIILLFRPVAGQQLRVAAAANAQYAVAELIEAFTDSTGIETEMISTSSGKLAAQIRNGAPYDVFLSADMSTVESLCREGFCGSEVIPYAVGRLVIWTVNDLDLSAGLQSLLHESIKKIAIANPETAPYGAAAIESLKSAGLYDSVSSKLVFGESISQVNQYVMSGTAEIGLTSKSVVLSKMKGQGTWVAVPDSIHSALIHGMAITSFGKQNHEQGSMQFLRFVSSPAAARIFENHGYGKISANQTRIIESENGNSSAVSRAASWEPFWLTFKLAGITTLILLLIGIPLAWWLASGKWKIKPVLEAMIALPVVLPPTVLGFYLLLLLSPQSGPGRWFDENFGIRLAFEFEGLAMASVIYSLPFMVQPLQTGFESIPKALKEAAQSMGKNRYQILIRVLLPNMKPSLITGTVLSFAHTVGEFGVVLMIGGMIPGKTRVASVAIYDELDNLNFENAHMYASVLLGLSFLVLLLVYSVNKKLKT